MLKFKWQFQVSVVHLWRNFSTASDWLLIYSVIFSTRSTRIDIYSSIKWQEIKMPTRSFISLRHIEYQRMAKNVCSESKFLSKYFSWFFLFPRNTKITFLLLPFHGSVCRQLSHSWKEYLGMFTCCLPNVWYEYLLEHLLCKWFWIWSRNCLPQINSIANPLRLFVVELVFAMNLVCLWKFPQTVNLWRVRECQKSEFPPCIHKYESSLMFSHHEAISLATNE